MGRKRMTVILLTVIMILTMGTLTVPVSAAGPTVTYRTHIQKRGWQGWKTNGTTSGTSGESLRLEAIQIALKNVSGGIQYRTHIQKIGWQGWKKNGATSGTYGQSLRLEAIQIKLTGAAAQQYDIYYRVHAQKFGWMGWAKNGASAGSSGYSYRLEAIQIRLVAKNGTAPGSTANAYRKYTPVMAGAINGSTGYFHTNNAIYKMNLSTGSASKIKTISGSSSVHDVSYYNGYLYFAVNYFIGTSETDMYVCRMKTDGSGFKKLSPGWNPVVYGNRIYYTSATVKSSSYGEEYTVANGISSMKPDGSDRKMLKANSGSSWNYIERAVLGDRIYYTQGGTLYSMSLSGTDAKKITSTTYGLKCFVSGNTLYYTSRANYSSSPKLYSYNASTGTSTVLTTFSSSTTIAGMYGGNVYYTPSASYGQKSSTLYRYNVASKTGTKLGTISSGYIREIQVTNGTWMAVEQTYNTSDKTKNMAVSKMKVNGSSYTALQTYFES